jgi:hypothetical protein
LFARKNNPASLLREAVRAEFRVGKHAARRAVRKPSRLTVAIAAVATAGGMAAAVGGTVAWASDSHPAASHAAAYSDSANSKNRLTSDNLAPRVPDAKGKPQDLTHAAKPAGTASHAAAVKPAQAHKPAAPAKPKAPAKPAAKHKPAAPAKPYQIYDSVTPSSIPAGKNVAVYGNGAYQASWSDVAGRGKVLWIDVHGNNTGCDALDVEPGDATPAEAAAWVKAKLSSQPNSKPIVYTMRSWWPAVTASMNSLPGWMHSHVKYWIADPTGYEHILPGADATQWYWGKSVDITTAKPGFWK